jgi:NAD-dependent DNA ligase
MDFKKNPQTDFKEIDDLSKEEAKDEVEALREGIEYHNYRYYRKNDPVISDATYDRLFARLQELEEAFPNLSSESSPTRRVGAAPVKGFKRVEHAAPMLSLNAALEEKRSGNSLISCVAKLVKNFFLDCRAQVRRHFGGNCLREREFQIRCHSRRAMAWKFEPKQEITTLEKIVVQVGNSGILNPGALIQPVDVGGVTVSRATLHNEREVEEKDLREGDKMRIERAGDVIPEVVERIERSNKYARKFHMPDTCPTCGSEVVREGVYGLCPAGRASIDSFMLWRSVMSGGGWPRLWPGISAAWES